MKTPIVCLGAGGHAKMIAEILERQSLFAIETYLTEGRDCELPAWRERGITHFVVGLGAPLRRRAELYATALALGMTPVAVIHESAIVSPSVRCGEGVTLLPLAVINADARLGENVLINSGAIIEHDCRIGSHTHVAIGARICGGVTIGEGVLIGAGATLLPGVEIGQNAQVGAGAVVLESVAADTTVVGVPARACL